MKNNSQRWRLAQHWGRAVLGRGALPDFIILGTQKGGTITLWENLNQHPDIHLPTSLNPTPREMYFFDRQWHKGSRWYRAHFLQTDKLQGEKTPSYLPSHACHPRLHQLIPKARLICLLRNPVERAYSAWNMLNQVADRIPDYQATSFEQAIEQRPTLLSDGQYIDHIDSLLRFFPRQQLFIGISERFKQDLAGELARVFAFLGVENHPGSTQNHHVRRYDQTMDATIREQLTQHFATHNRRLQAFLDDPLDEWSIPPA